jgi:hypothetical protein
MKEIYGVSRSRDKKGVIVKQNLNPYVNCIHTLVGGGGWDTMLVAVMEIEYENNQVRKLPSASQELD